MIKKLLTMLLAIVMSFSVVACGGGGEDYSDTTLILVDLDDGGLGTLWLERAGARFSKLKKDTSYAPGKKGVVVKPIPVGVVSTTNAASSGTHIFVQPYVSNVKSIVNEGNVLNINDLVIDDTYEMRDGQPISIEDKLGDYTERYKGADGDYYAVPASSFFACLSYDVDNWEKYGLYFANQEAIDSGAVQEFECTTLNNKTFYFVEEENTDKSLLTCGPDGKVGTADDGMASSLHEFIALCEFMRDDKSINPLYVTGQHLAYSNFLLEAIMTNLMGYDRARTMYEFDGGDFEVVTGFYDEPLFPGAGVDDIKKPKTQIVQLTEESGYYYSWAVEKYYAEAFMDLAMAKGWFHQDSYDTSTSNRHAMENFIFNGVGNIEKIGMLIETSLWYCEAELEGKMDMYENQANNAENVLTKRLSVMSLPINFSETVEETEGRGQTVMEVWKEMMFINKHRTENNEEMLKACLDFIQFLSSDDELSKYTSENYIFKAMDYDINAEDLANMDYFGKELLKFYEIADVSYAYATSATFNNNPGIFDGGYSNNGYFMYSSYNSYFQAKKAYNENNKKLNCHDVFVSQSVSKSAWAGIYGGKNEIVSGAAGDSINATPSGRS